MTMSGHKSFCTCDGCKKVNQSIVDLSMFTQGQLERLAARRQAYLNGFLTEWPDEVDHRVSGAG